MKSSVAPIVLCLMCLLSPPASAQSLKLPTIVYSGVMVADWVSTIAVAPPGSTFGDQIVIETNPLVNWMGSNPKIMYVAGAAMDVGALWAIHRVFGKKHPKATKVLLYTVASFRTIIVVNNVRFNRRHN